MDSVWQSLLTPEEWASYQALPSVPWSYHGASGVRLVGVGLKVSKVSFAQMIRAMPNVFKQDRHHMRFYVGPEQLLELRLQLASRTTVGVDVAFRWDEDPPLTLYGVQVVEEPGLSALVLTAAINWPVVVHPERIVVGVFGPEEPA